MTILRSRFEATVCSQSFKEVIHRLAKKSAQRSREVQFRSPEETMSSKTGRHEPCECGSGKKYKNCCGTPKLEVASVRVKDVKDVELTPGLAEAFTSSSYCVEII